MLNTIIIAVFWLIFAFLTGKIEGWLYHYRNSKDTFYETDLHPLFGLSRLVVVLIALQYYIGSWSNMFFMLAFAMLIFPFIHDGSYYLQRFKLSGVYNNKFFTNQNTSTAKVSLEKAWMRIALFIIGLGCLGLVIFGIQIHWKIIVSIIGSFVGVGFLVFIYKIVLTDK